MDEKNMVKGTALALPIIVFILVAIYAFSGNIHDDAFTHAIFGQSIAEEGDVLDSFPFRVMNITNEEIIYSPIPYSELFHVKLAEIYLYGGMDSMKLFSPFLAAMTAVVVFSLLRRINLALAFFTPILMTLVCIHRLSMVPLMEQTFYFTIFLSILTYWKFYKTLKLQYAILTGIFLGISFATKQTGMLAAGAIIGHFLIMNFYDWYKNSQSGNHPIKDSKYCVGFIICILVIAIVAAIPLVDQYERNGTLGYSPGQTRVPSFIPFNDEINECLGGKYGEDPLAVEEMKSIIGYYVMNITLLDTAKQYLTFPQTFTNSLKTEPLGSNIWIIPDFILFLLGTIFLWNRTRFLTSVLLVIAAEEFLTTYLFSQRVEQYHIIGLAVFTIFFVAGILQTVMCLRTWVKIPVVRKIVIATFISVILISTSIGYIDIVHKKIYGNEGRQSDLEMLDFEELGIYVSSNTPQEALFISPWGNFIYFSKRDCVWINEGGNSFVPTLLKTTNESEAVQILSNYDISYIVFNKRQLNRNGVIDYFPGHGLLDYIDESPHFQLEFVSSSGEVKLYSFNVGN